MIKILEHGTIQKKRCEDCGCLFSYEKEDVEHKNNKLDPLLGRYDYVTCPQCKKEITIGVLEKCLK